MTTTSTPADLTLPCPPWCADPAGHNDEWRPDDQSCASQNVYEPMPLMFEVHRLDPRFSWEPSTVTAYAFADQNRTEVQMNVRHVIERFGGTDNQAADFDLSLTPAEARELAARLTKAADFADAEPK